MRIIIIVLTICLVSCQAMMALEMAPVLDERDKARDKAEQDYKVKLADADKKALTKLSSLAHSAKDTDRIEVYKEMLRIDSKNEEAVKYFTALGTLDATLLSLSKPSSEDMFKEFIIPKTDADWKALKGVEFKLDSIKTCNASEENSKACTLPSNGLKVGSIVRIVMHPVDQQTSPTMEDKTQAYWQKHLSVRTGEGDKFTKLTDLKGGVYTVGDYPIEFKWIGGANNLEGTLRMKVILLNK